MALYIKSDGTEIEVFPKNGTDFSYPELKNFLNFGNIEIVRTKDDKNFIVLDEEGKLKNLPINEKATALYNNANDYIAGDVLICKTSQIL